MVDFALLTAPFAKDAVSWRAQNISKKDDGSAQALALAYIDARDVMNRLDDVCTPAGWQCEYPIANGKTICRIGILINENWILKAAGAGDTDIEAEKGAISDAFKRAAVKWGIGRYLYDLESVWVPCHLNSNGKWKSWVVDPWTKVKADQKSGFETFKKQNGKWETIADELRGVENEKELAAIWIKYQPELTVFKRCDPEILKQLEDIKDNMKLELIQLAGMPQGFREVRNGR